MTTTTIRDFNHALAHINFLNATGEFKQLADIVNYNEFDNTNFYNLTNEQNCALNDLITLMFAHNDELFFNYDDGDDFDNTRKYANSIETNHETLVDVLNYIGQCSFEQLYLIYHADYLGFDIDDNDKLFLNYIIENKFNNANKSLKA